MTDTIRSDDARALMNSQISEAAWQAQILELAALNGWTAFHIPDALFKALHAQGRAKGYQMPQAGFPDTVLVRPPRLVFAELKSESGSLTNAQKIWLELLRACHVEVYCWKPRDWDVAKETLSREPGGSRR